MYMYTQKRTIIMISYKYKLREFKESCCWKNKRGKVKGQINIFLFERRRWNAQVKKRREHVQTPEAPQTKL